MINVLNKNKKFPEVGKGITPLKDEGGKLRQMYKLKNVDNLIFFKYLTIISFIAWAGSICLVFTAFRTSSDIYGFIALTGVTPFVLQTIYLLILSVCNKWLANKSWLQKPLFKTRYNKGQVLLICLFVMFIMMNGGTNMFEASNVMFMLMLVFTGLAFYDTGNISLSIMMNSILKIFEHLILVNNVSLPVALTINTIIPFVFYITYKKIIKKRQGETTNEENKEKTV